MENIPEKTKKKRKVKTTQELITYHKEYLERLLAKEKEITNKKISESFSFLSKNYELLEKVSEYSSKKSNGFEEKFIIFIESL
jgi:hypothetical protein